ncbi:MAG TPA: TonB-dependent receptor [Cyclobacteriaceae bacterium]|nr:TonB-dependent receptor [Cyclobacteriaceae bacterium]
MLKIKMLLAAMLLSAGAFAQQAFITGVVKDAKSNQVLTGATVRLSSGPVTATDEFGKFRFGNLLPGDYTVSVTFLGYADYSEKISLTESAELVVRLEESYKLTDELVVYATRAHNNTPTTYTNVNQQAIQKQNFGQDMPFILNWTPSLVTTSDAGAGIGYTGVRIRGSDATRINVTINGIAYNDSESQGTFWVNLPDIASSTQSVQIQRGVGTSTNGAGSFGGSVNVQTLSQQRDPYAEVMLGGGSFNTQRYTVKAGTGLINNHWTFDGRASRIKSDGYIDRASSDLDSYYFSGGYYGDKTIVKAIVFGGQEITYQSWNGIDGATMKENRTFNSAGALYDADWNVTGYYDNEVDNYKQDHYQLHFTQTLAEHWNANVALHYTYGRGYYEQYKQAKPFAELGLEDMVIGDSTLTYGDFIIRKWLDNRFYGTTFSFNYENEKTVLTLGGAYNQYARAKHFGELVWAQHASNASAGDHYYAGESQKNDFNVYAKWNYALTTRLNAFVDVQYRNVSYQTKGNDDDLSVYNFTDNLNFFNPKAGASYTLTGTDVVYASYAVANREPSRGDYVDGEVKPKPERLGNLETGWKRTTEHYSVEANYYLMNYTDQLVLTGKLDNVGNPIRANVGKSYRTGVEISGMLRLADRLSWNANITLSRNKNKDYVLDAENGVVKNTSIILSPDVIAGSQLFWNAFTGFQAGLLTKYVGKQYLDNTQTESLMLDAYVVNDLRLTYSFKPRGVKGTEVSLLINNLFDVEYESNGATYGDGVAYYFPQAGINFLTMVTFKF